MSLKVGAGVRNRDRTGRDRGGIGVGGAGREEGCWPPWSLVITVKVLSPPSLL